MIDYRKPSGQAGYTPETGGESDAIDVAGGDGDRARIDEARRGEATIEVVPRARGCKMLQRQPNVALFKRYTEQKGMVNSVPRVYSGRRC